MHIFSIWSGAWMHILFMLGICTGNTDPDQKSQNAAADQGLHCPLIQKFLDFEAYITVFTLNIQTDRPEETV